MTLRALIYARVSSAAQREKHTIGSQLTELPAHVKREGWALTETITDDGRSGETVDARPGFQRVLEMAEAKAFDVLVVIDLDRITRARKSAEGAMIYDSFREWKIRLSVPGQSLVDLDDEDQDFFVGLKREMAKWEKRKILRRVSRGKREALRLGKRHHCRDPFGLVWVVDAALASGGSYQLRANEAAVIRRMVDLALAGRGIAWIVWTLNNEGARTRPTKKRPKGGAWQSTSVRRLLRSPTLKGTFELLKGTDHVMRVPAVVDVETWARLQVALDGRRIASARKTDGEYLLAGVARCGVCGHAMWVVKPKAGRTEKAYYRCRTTNAWRTMMLDGPCGNRHHETAATDALVWREIRQRLASPTLLDEARARLASDANAGAELLRRAAAARARLVELEGFEAEVLARRRRGVLSAAACDHELEQLAKERAGVERALAAAERLIADAQGGAERLRELERARAALAARIDGADFETRRAIVKVATAPPHGTVKLHRDGAIEVQGIAPDDDAELSFQVAPETPKSARKPGKSPVCL